jgi:uncharacterized membrane protein YGL010W
MKTMQQWLDEYGESHKNATNKTIHFICVPLIYFSIMGLIWEIPFPWLEYRLFGFQLNWAIISAGLVFAYYTTLSAPISIGMLLFSAACLFLLRLLDYQVSHIAPIWAISIAIFVLAWIGQFYGHNIEGKKPSFLKDLQFLMIGPAWIMSFILSKLKINY